METIAVYWEKKIKTYGFWEKTGLSLFKISFPLDRMSEWGSLIQGKDDNCNEFVMVAAQVIANQKMQISLLLDPNMDDQYSHEVKKKAENEPDTSIRVYTPVELIYFQGPHFGDRYGIADAALGTLVENNLTVLASVCTGSSIYIAVPENKARIAVKLLSENFVVPQS